ncbi:MAG: hypothetical protein ACP5NS_03730 [Candidatus Pacearchaeota archaeon]
MGLNIIASTFVWIFLIGGFTLFLRKKICTAFTNVSNHRFILFILMAMIYSFFEEHINCPPTGCTLFPPTLIVFFVMIIIHYLLLLLFKVKNFYLGVLLFGIMGWISEFVFGAHTQILWSSPSITILFTLWTILTYCVIVIIPVTIFLSKNK